MAIGFPVKDDYVTGDVLTAANMNDLSGTVNLLDSAQYAAGKNKIINGDFSVNQRNFSSTTTTAEYNFDRWRTIYTGGTSTTSLQTFTLGAAPVAGYEGKNFYQVAVTGQAAVTDFVRVQQQIESVRTLAGQTATISFWAKASAGTPKIALNMVQSFGTGGSPSAGVETLSGTVTTSTSWARYSITVAIPSISGKTFGTAPDDALSIRLMLSGGSSVTAAQSIGLQNVTFDIWGVQVEAGSVASAFQTATGTIQGELAACQRYYYRMPASGAYTAIGQGAAYSTTAVAAYFPFASTMRVAPTALDFSTLAVQDIGSGGFTAITGATTNAPGTTGSQVNLTGASGLTQFRPYIVSTNNSTSGYLGFSAEL